MNRSGRLRGNSTGLVTGGVPAPLAGAVRAAVAVVAALVLAGTAVPGNATASARATVGSAAWAIQHMPSPLTRSGLLSGVSCASAHACMAVGSYQTSSGAQVALAEAWNGTAWSVQPVPSPPGATASFLLGVSCTAPGACTAVGYYASGPSTQIALAEAWNGTTWSVQAVPVPAGAALSSLAGVSCTSASACIAVGDTNNGELAEAWNGTAWSVQSTPKVSGGGSLAGVWCTAPGACIAVGHYLSGRPVRGPLAEAWNGTAWSVQAVPVPPGATQGSLAGVSCTSASACTAVGQYGNRHGISNTLAEGWNGAAWSVQQAPRLSGQTDLLGVSCTAPGACTAVGEEFTSSSPVTVAEAWNGTVWSVQPTPSPVGPEGGSLAGVSCGPASACTAVGRSATALAEAWNGTSWSDDGAVTPTRAAESRLSGVSCVSASSCVAVGSYVPTLGFSAGLAEMWNGTSWRIERIPLPPGGAQSVLSGVSCSSPTACTAVGYYNNRVDLQFTLAEAWNGTSWSVQPTPNPAADTFGVFLTGVSCTSPSACTAVGYSESGELTAATLAEAWNGTSWSIQPMPQTPGSVRHVLNAVSCTSAGACTAVGSVGYDTLAEAWNGSTWSKQATPQATGIPHSLHTLNGVSCTSPTACVAVGSGFGTMLAEAWNGTSWSLQPTPSPGVDFYNHLGGVSCASATACTAVWSSAFRTVAGQWNGTRWSLQPTPTPAGSNPGYHVLSSVSCAPASACTAVGYHPSGVGWSVLAEAKS